MKDMEMAAALVDAGEWESSDRLIAFGRSGSLYHLYRATAEGDREEYRNAALQLHRAGAPAVIDGERGVVEYWFDGLRHRGDGPAFLSGVSGVMLYFQSGRLHRTDGPAMILADGKIAFFLEGEAVEEKDIILYRAIY